MEEKDKKQTPIQMLLDTSRPFPPQYLHIFSDITAADLAEIQKIWPQIAVTRKINLLHDLEAMMEADTLLSCDDFARFALEDEDANVRSRAISLLWECEDLKIAHYFSHMLENDESEIVRAAAAAALGKFVLMGELEEISRESFNRIISLLMKIYELELFDKVRTEILRALAYSGKKEIAGLIAEAFTRKEKEWKLAALESMGRSADTRWQDHILDTLESSDTDFLYEAVRAAGELELKPARMTLLQILEEELDNEDLRFQVIWALSKIGGDAVYETLQDLLDNAVTDQEIEVLELALENLEFIDDNSELDIL